MTVLLAYVPTAEGDAGSSPHSVAEVLDAVRVRFEQAGADVVVIGLRRRTAVGRLVLDSTSSRLLLGLDCPVLAVKGLRDPWLRRAGPFRLKPAYGRTVETTSEALHRRVGSRDVGTFTEIGWKQDRWVDVRWYEKALS